MKNILKSLFGVLVLCLALSPLSFAGAKLNIGQQSQVATGGVGNINVASNGAGGAGGQFVATGPPTFSEVVSTGGNLITGILISTNNTSEYVGIFDSAFTNYEAFDVPAEAVFYAYVPFFTTQYFDFHASPIRTNQGIYVTQSSGTLPGSASATTLGNVLVYTQSQNQ